MMTFLIFLTSRMPVRRCGGLALLLASVLLAPVASADGTLLVIANLGADQKITLSREQVRNLFMGIPVGESLTPVVLTADNKARAGFNTRVIGMAEARIQSYWAQMKFTGRKTPPAEFRSEAELIEFVQKTPGSIGYVSASTKLPDNLQVVYEDAR
ncbi:hypothetical protein [Parathalassolituus penaei]|uniref:Phosphate ABC transporter substrate-binding protein n=1 Tax=Parathalassolituus penaei TaxID=2997323 RepID=A0A9X3ISR9_9GAMM|nr:hypothetical protein [Parathalassolituus penaei]MCY0965169.1 hypothetical protein [Parathalassolituus penaei]